MLADLAASRTSPARWVILESIGRAALMAIAAPMTNESHFGIIELSR
jgi:hypothetical protein